MDIGRERLQRRDVQNACFVRQLPTCFQPLTEQLIYRMEKGGQGLTRTGRRSDQGVLARTDGGPSAGLGPGRGEICETSLPPGLNDRMELLHRGWLYPKILKKKTPRRCGAPSK